KQAAIRDTIALLRRMGITSSMLYDYDLHVPMLINKEKRDKMTAAIRRFNPGMTHIMARSLYGNMFVQGQKMNDVKIYDLLSVPKGRFCSTTDESFLKGKAGVAIKEAFPDTCIYEA